MFVLLAPTGTQPHLPSLSSVDEAGAPVDVILATGSDFPDALAAGPLSAAAVNGNAGAIVLNQGASLLPSREGTTSLCYRHIHIVGGGTARVPASIATELNAMGKNVQRSGATREETAAAVATALGTDGDNSAILEQP